MKSEFQVLDTRGNTCPIPLFLTNSRLRQMAPGEILEVISDCSSLLPDLRSLFRKRCVVLESKNENDLYRITLKKS